MDLSKYIRRVQEQIEKVTHTYIEALNLGDYKSSRAIMENIYDLGISQHFVNLEIIELVKEMAASQTNPDARASLKGLEMDFINASRELGLVLRTMNNLQFGI